MGFEDMAAFLGCGQREIKMQPNYAIFRHYCSFKTCLKDVCTVRKMNSTFRQIELTPKTQTDIGRKFRLKALR
jgi:hypothetical protein